MAVLLVTLHLEIITQAHYVDAMKDNGDVEPLFVSLFKHHWLEEAQHAKLDVLELEKLREGASPEQIALAEQEYIEILHAFAGLLGRQAALDAGSGERCRQRQTRRYAMRSNMPRPAATTAPFCGTD